jgi:hypothetical protein
MSAGPEGSAGRAPGAGGAPGEGPAEEELRAAYEAELSRITAIDMIGQAAVSLLNIAARRLGPPAAAEGAPGEPQGGRDLEQARDAIDASRALVEILERRVPGELGPIKDALSRLQMAYAAEVGGPGGAPAGGGESGAAGGGESGGSGGGESGGSGGGESGAGSGGQTPQQQPEPGQRRPGPAESSGRLWVPGS